MSLFNQNTNQPANTNTGQTGGLFGNTSNTQQQQPLFGGLNTAQASSNQPATSIFGNPLSGTNTNVGGGLFGAQSTTTNPNQGTGLFGGAQQQQPQQSAAGGLFGGASNPQQQQSAGGGLFGTQQPATGGLFGGTSNQQQQQNTGGGLFGNPTTQQQQQPQQQQGGGLFGSTTQQQQPQQGGGLFGSTTQQQQPQQGGGLFGSTTQQQQPQQQGGLFGSTTPTAGGLFGSKPGGLFGSTLGVNTNTSGTSPSTNTSPGSLFGGAGQFQQQPAGSLFGQPAQQQQQQQQQQQRPSLFGNLGQSTTSPNPLFGAGSSTLGTSTLGVSTLGGGGGGFGASTPTTNGLLSSRGPVGPAQQQADLQVQHNKIMQRIDAIYLAWNTGSPQCRFQYTFYNLVNPAQVSLYRQPPNIPNEMWEKAVRENPDPTRLVPVIAFGFDDLRERVEAQSRQADEHKTRLKDLKASLEALSSRHALSNTSRLQRASALQVQITHRLLALIRRLHLLIPAIRSSSITPEEELLRGKLEEIEEDLRKGRFKGKLNELWALIGAVNASRERGRGANGGEWAVVDDDGLSQIAQILSEQQAGLAHLTKILQKDLKDLSIIMGTPRSGTEEESRYMNDGAMWSSTSTLRASALR